MQESRRLAGAVQDGGTRYVFAASGGPERERGTKVCPQCGELLFADMDVCFGCLYEFGRDEQRRAPESRGLSLVGPVEERPLRADGGGGRTVDPLDGIDLDEIDDETEDLEFGIASQDGQTAPRHRKTSAGSAESTMDLAQPAPPSSPKPVATAPGRFRICARSPDMWVHIPLLERGLSIGRGETNDIVLNSRAVSRNHLRLVPMPDKVLVEDCGATNPATIDGKKLEGSASLGVGGLVVVCGTEFEVEDDPPYPAA